MRVGHRGVRVCSGAQCLPAVGCRMRVQWDTVSLYNEGGGARAMGLGAQKGAQLGAGGVCNGAGGALAIGHEVGAMGCEDACSMGCLHNGAWGCMRKGYQMPTQWGAGLCVQWGMMISMPWGMAYPRSGAQRCAC